MTSIRKIRAAAQKRLSRKAFLRRWARAAFKAPYPVISAFTNSVAVGGVAPRPLLLHERVYEDSWPPSLIAP